MMGSIHDNMNFSQSSQNNFNNFQHNQNTGFPPQGLPPFPHPGQQNPFQ